VLDHRQLDDRLLHDRVARLTRPALRRGIVLGGALLLASLATWWVAAGRDDRPYVVAGASMEPTLHCAGAPGCERLQADRLELARGAYARSPPRRGDVVVIRLPATATRRCAGERVYVKRIVALPGERVGIRHGRVEIDGEPLREPYLAPGSRGRSDLATMRVGRHRYFVLGDNREISCDSRYLGPIDGREILGKVVKVIRSSG
jgi:signal peptidase I